MKLSLCPSLQRNNYYTSGLYRILVEAKVAMSSGKQHDAEVTMFDVTAAKRM